VFFYSHGEGWSGGVGSRARRSESTEPRRPPIRLHLCTHICVAGGQESLPRCPAWPTAPRHVGGGCWSRSRSRGHAGGWAATITAVGLDMAASSSAVVSQGKLHRPLRSHPVASKTDSIMTGSTLDLVALLRNSEHSHGVDKGGCCDHPAAPMAVPSRPSRPPPVGTKEVKPQAPTDVEDDERLFSYLIQEVPAAKSPGPHGAADVDGVADDHSDVPTLSASVTESIGDPLGPDSPNLGDAAPAVVRSPSPPSRRGVLSMAVASDRQNSCLLRPPQPCGASMGGITKAVAICVPFAMDDDWRSEDSEPSSLAPVDADCGDDEGGERMDVVDAAVTNCRRDAAGNCRAIRTHAGGGAPVAALRSTGPPSMSATSSSDASSERSRPPGALGAGKGVPATKRPLTPCLPTSPAAPAATVRPAAETLAAALAAAVHPLPPSPEPPVTPAASATAGTRPTSSPAPSPPLPSRSAAGLLLRGLEAPTATPPPVAAAAKAPAAKRPAGRTHGDASAVLPTVPTTPVRPRGGRPSAAHAGNASSVVVAPAGAAVAAAPTAVPGDLNRRVLARSTSSGTVEGDAAGTLTDAPGMATDVCLSPMPSLCLSPPLGISLSPSPDVSLSSLVPILCLAAAPGGKVNEVAAAASATPAPTKVITRPMSVAVANDGNFRRTSPVGGISIPPAPEVRRATAAAAVTATATAAAGTASTACRGGVSSGPTSSTSLAPASVESRPFAPVSTSPFASTSSMHSLRGGANAGSTGGSGAGAGAAVVAAAPMAGPRPGASRPPTYVPHPGAHPGAVPAGPVDPRYGPMYAAHGGRAAYHAPPPGAYAMGPMGPPYGVPPGAHYWVPHPSGGAVVYPGTPHGAPGGYPGAPAPVAEAARNARSDRDKVYVRCVCGQDNHIRRLACSRCARRKEAKPIIKKQSRAIARKERAAAAAAAAAAGPPRASTILPRSFTSRSPHTPGTRPAVGVHGLAPAPPPGGVPVVSGGAPPAGGWWVPPPGAHGAYPMASGAPPSASHPHAHPHPPPPPHAHAAVSGPTPAAGGAPHPAHPVMVPGGGNSEVHSHPLGPMNGWGNHAYPHPAALADISAAVVASVAASGGGSPPPPGMGSTPF